MRELTERRIADYIKDLALAGIISAEVRSLGNYGRTKIIKLDIQLDLIEKVIAQIDKISMILNYKPLLLQSNKVNFKSYHFKKLI